MVGIEFGTINCYLKKVMVERSITIYKLAKLTDLKYDVILRYYNNQIMKFDSMVLAKLCYTLDCSINDLLKYEI